MNKTALLILLMSLTFPEGRHSHTCKLTLIHTVHACALMHIRVTCNLRHDHTNRLINVNTRITRRRHIQRHNYYNLHHLRTKSPLYEGLDTSITCPHLTKTFTHAHTLNSERVSRHHLFLYVCSVYSWRGIVSTRGHTYKLQGAESRLQKQLSVKHCNDWQSKRACHLVLGYIYMNNK